jgi:hypothetical protein
MAVHMVTTSERKLWRIFLAAEPAFSGDRIGSAVDGPDPPDVLCVTVSGKRIGVDVASWDESEQTKWRRTRESFEDSYLRIIESANHARPDRIGWVWLHPKRREVKPEDVAQFREELYEFLARENGLSEPEWNHPLGAAVQDFVGYPVITEYLDSLWIFPRRELEVLPSGHDWIRFENLGAAYSTSWMLGGAVGRILAKIADYEEQDLHMRHILDELYLVCDCSDESLQAENAANVHDEFVSLASRIARALAKGHGVFDRVFLFNLFAARKVLRVYPAGSFDGKEGICNQQFARSTKTI